MRGSSREFLDRLRYESRFVIEDRNYLTTDNLEGLKHVGTGMVSPNFAENDNFPTFVGFDTNALSKALEGRGDLADDIDRVLSEHGTIRIVPRQSVIEYWNNFKKFNNSELYDRFKFMDQLESGLRAIPDSSPFDELKGQLEGPVRELNEELKEYGGKRRAETVKPLLDLVVGKNGIVPALHGTEIHDIGVARAARKAPPGFMDASKGLGSLGDFYVWAEFLFGLYRLRPSGAAFTTNKPPSEWAIFLTDEKKSDWKPGGSFHPILVEEALQVTGVPVQIMGFKKFRGLLRV